MIIKNSDKSHTLILMNFKIIRRLTLFNNLELDMLLKYMNISLKKYMKEKKVNLLVNM